MTREDDERSLRFAMGAQLQAMGAIRSLSRCFPSYYYLYLYLYLTLPLLKAVPQTSCLEWASKLLFIVSFSSLRFLFLQNVRAPSAPSSS